MTQSGIGEEGRVAVYIDFDNVVISRYDQLNGDGSWRRDKVRSHTGRSGASAVAQRIDDATIDISAILDYASSFGTIVLSRAYADWSVPVNASYRMQLLERAVDLTQMFPTVASMKNGADIRLAVDVVEDLFRLDDLTHIVIVSGDSDYIPLTQRAKRLGRYVVGIGVAGGTSRMLAAACDEFADYDSLPGVGAEEIDDPGDSTGSGRPAAEQAAPAQTAQPGEAADITDLAEPQTQRRRPSTLLVRALELLQAKQDEEWIQSGTVKSQMLRMDPSFSESTGGYPNFTDFLRSRGNLVELRDEAGVRSIRLRRAKKAK